MTTLATIQANVADMLRGRTDLNSQILTEIGLAVAQYSRRATWITELRNGTIATVSGTTYYSTIDNSSSISYGTGLTGTAPTSTDSVSNMLELTFAKLTQGSTDWPLTRLPYKEFEAMLVNSSVSGTPDYITLYAGQIGLWPTPNAVFTLTLSGKFKPIVPSAATHESIFFDQHRELIELSVAKRMAQKWTHDPELVQLFSPLVMEQEQLLMAEGVSRRTTGRLRSSF